MCNRYLLLVNHLLSSWNFKIRIQLLLNINLSWIRQCSSTRQWKCWIMSAFNITYFWIFTSSYFPKHWTDFLTKIGEILFNTIVPNGIQHNTMQSNRSLISTIPFEIAVWTLSCPNDEKWIRTCLYSWNWNVWGAIWSIGWRRKENSWFKDGILSIRKRQ